MNREYSDEYAEKFFAQHADASEEIKRFRYLIDRAKGYGNISADVWSELGSSFERIVIKLVDITQELAKEQDDNMECPWCGHPDLRDLGFVRGHHIYMCRNCNKYGEKSTELVRVTNPETLSSLTMESGPEAES